MGAFARVLLAGLVLGMAVTSCARESTLAPPVTVALSRDSIILDVGQTFSLSTVVTGSQNSLVTWTSSAPAIATVSQGGVVTGVAPGATVVTASAVVNIQSSARTKVVVRLVPGGSNIFAESGGAYGLAFMYAIAPSVRVSVGEGISVIRQGTEILPVAITRTSYYGGDLALSTSGLPAGVSASFSPAQLPAGRDTAILELRADAGAAIGRFDVNVVAGRTGVVQGTAILPLAILDAPPTLQVGESSAGGTLTISSRCPPQPSSTCSGNSTTVTLNVARNGYLGDIVLAAEGLPSFLASSFSDQFLTGSRMTSTATITYSSFARPPDTRRSWSRFERARGTPCPDPSLFRSRSNNMTGDELTSCATDGCASVKPELAIHQ